MFARIAQGIVPALTALVAVKATEYLQSIQVPKIESILIGAVAAALASGFANEFIGLCKGRSFFIRKILDPRARFEGDWFVETAPGSRMPYGAVSIQYNEERNAYTYSGAAYDVNGQLASEWWCDNLQFELPNARANFICDAAVKGGKGAQHKAVGWLSFQKTHLRRRLRYARGNGFYALVAEPDMKGEFSLDRLDRGFVKGVLGRPCIATRDEMALVVEKYHAHRLDQKAKAAKAVADFVPTISPTGKQTLPIRT